MTLLELEKIADSMIKESSIATIKNNFQQEELPFFNVNDQVYCVCKEPLVVPVNHMDYSRDEVYYIEMCGKCELEVQ